MEEKKMGIPQLKGALFSIMREEGGFTPRYYTKSLKFVETRMASLEAEINADFFKGSLPWVRAAPAEKVDLNTERYATPLFEEARAAIGSAGLAMSVGAWYLAGGMGTRFSPHVLAPNEKLTLEQTIEFCGMIGVSSMSFHTQGEMGPTNREAALYTLAQHHMKVGSEFANLFTETPFKFGGVTSPYTQVQELAYLRKLQGFFWCAQDNTAFQVDWLGQDGQYTFDQANPRRQMLVEYYADMMMLTGRKIALEFKPGDPAIFMTEDGVESSLRVCQDAENLVYSRIKENVAAAMKGGGMEEIVAESVKRFSQFAGSMGINIEDAHVYTKTAQIVAHATETSINAGLTTQFLDDVRMLKGMGYETKEADTVIANYTGRLFHRHPNDAFVGNGDPDLLPGMVHESDLVVSSYHERKAGLHQKIVYEPDLFAVRDDPLENVVEAFNRINRAHAIAANLIKIEDREITNGFLAPDQSILDVGQARLSAYMREANEMPLDYRAIPLSVASAYRKMVGKEILFQNKPFERDTGAVPGGYFVPAVVAK